MGVAVPRRRLPSVHRMDQLFTATAGKKLFHGFCVCDEGNSLGVANETRLNQPVLSDWINYWTGA